MANVAKLAVGLAAGAALCERANRSGAGARAWRRDARPMPQRLRMASRIPVRRAISASTEPNGWNNRPATVDRGAYQHNYQAARTYTDWTIPPSCGLGCAPLGLWRDPAARLLGSAVRAVLTTGCFLWKCRPLDIEWVRDGNDALLINTANGEILQVEYGVFG